MGDHLHILILFMIFVSIAVLVLKLCPFKYIYMCVGNFNIFVCVCLSICVKLCQLSCYLEVYIFSEATCSWKRILYLYRRKHVIFYSNNASFCPHCVLLSPTFGFRNSYFPTFYMTISAGICEMPFDSALIERNLSPRKIICNC